MNDARTFIHDLRGRELRTVSGRPNRVLGIEGSHVRVATTRSPRGQLVPLGWVQAAMDRLEAEREIEISVESVGHRSAFVGAVLRELPGAEVVEGTSPPRLRLRRTRSAGTA